MSYGDIDLAWKVDKMYGQDIKYVKKGRNIGIINDWQIKYKNNIEASIVYEIKSFGEINI